MNTKKTTAGKTATKATKASKTINPARLKKPTREWLAKTAKANGCDPADVLRYLRQLSTGRIKGRHLILADHAADEHGRDVPAKRPGTTKPKTRKAATVAATRATKITLPAATLERAARQSGQTPERYIETSRKIATGRTVSARHVETKDGLAVFELSATPGKGDTKRNRATIENIDTGAAERVKRWYRYTEKHLAKIPSHTLRELQAMADAHGMSATDWTVCYLKATRIDCKPGDGNANGDEVRTNREFDFRCESETAQARAAHERDVVHMAVYHLGRGKSCNYTDDELRTLAEHFAAPGDWNLSGAKRRAVKFAIQSKQNAGRKPGKRKQTANH